ncbi:hypothetical protein RchiOBHm_Chr2g0097991 [Rosa chinensis]|uniref:Uncharacterized protein n=1 Tax=Rosa chinensis TaxID=74649 RepID=A0A2P6RLL0_ROSCH|nr:hypothetical protein RchiOBHm_Chr2g0097991 [Rosa chinensis]
MNLIILVLVPERNFAFQLTIDMKASGYVGLIKPPPPSPAVGFPGYREGLQEQLLKGF